MDESYFGGRRKGKRGRGDAGKVPVFGILKRGGKVFAQVISNAKATTLVPIIKQKVIPDSIVYSDTFKSYKQPLRRGLSPRPCEPFGDLRRFEAQPHQRYREHLEPGEETPPKVQRRILRNLQSASQRDRVPLESPSL